MQELWNPVQAKSCKHVQWTLSICARMAAAGFMKSTIKIGMEFQLLVKLQARLHDWFYEMFKNESRQKWKFKCKKKWTVRKNPTVSKRTQVRACLHDWYYTESWCCWSNDFTSSTTLLPPPFAGASLAIVFLSVLCSISLHAVQYFSSYFEVFLSHPLPTLRWQ